jgi:hypothetical protein
MLRDIHLPKSVYKRREFEPVHEPAKKPEEYGVAALIDGLYELSHDLLRGKNIWQQEQNGLRVQLRQLPDRVKGLLVVAERPERISFCLETTAQRKRIQCEVVARDIGDLVFELGVEIGSSRETLGVRHPGGETAIGNSIAPDGLYYANQVWQVLDSFTDNPAA